ncbi:MAG: hypothetical protein H7Z12_17575 [Rhodospirillaceae bacterium]|nr:hypothetical protein [Rhodospirillales bacterium]
MLGWLKMKLLGDPRYSRKSVRRAVAAGANAVGLTSEELENHCIQRTGTPFSKFVGEEPGGYRPSFYNSDNRVLADAYDAGREVQGDPRRAFRG